MVRAQNDIYMVVNNNGAEINSYSDDTLEALNSGRLTVGELQRSAMNICRFLIRTPAFAREGNGVVEIPMIKALAPDVQVENALKDNNRIVWNTAVETEKHFAVDTAGEYDVIVRLMSEQTEQAQCVCKAVLNSEELAAFQTNGTRGRWIQQKLLRVCLETGNYRIALRFPKPGMEIDYMEFRACGAMQ